MTKERQSMVERKKELEKSLAHHNAFIVDAAKTTKGKTTAATTTVGGIDGGQEDGADVATAAAGRGRGRGQVGYVGDKKKTIAKNRKELHLHALMTNIAWSFDSTATTTTCHRPATAAATNNTDASVSSVLLSGTVSDPIRRVHKTFVIDKEECKDECEIAERLWQLMEK